MRAFLLLPALLVLTAAAHADEARLRCVADTGVSSYPAERSANYGAASRIRLKGIEMVGLFRFDTAPVATWHVQSATLFLRYAGGDRKLRTLGFSTVAAPWEEGTGAGEVKPGEVCFDWRAQGKERWAGPFTDVTDVTYTAGHTLAAYADARDAGDGWLAVPVDARIVQAMIAGASYGMAVSDEKGQTHANNDIFAREQSASAPYLVVTGAPAASTPAAVAGLRATADPAHADFNHGALRLEFTAPSGAFAYEARVRAGSGEQIVARYRLPLAEPGKRQSVTLPDLPPGAGATVVLIPVSETGARGPEATATASVSAAKPRPAALTAPALTAATPPAPAGGSLRLYACADTAKIGPAADVPADANPVWDGAGVRLFGARGEILGFQLLAATDSPTRGITVTPPAELRGPGGAIRPDIALYRDWYVKDGDWQPEVCVPLKGTFDIPAADNGVPGQRNQSLFVDLRVPPTAAPGLYRGAFTVTAPGAPPRNVPIALTVNGLSMPDQLSFDISLNTYGTMAGSFGLDDRTPEYRALEREYHRMAHAHRGTLAILGYSHSGSTSTNYAPPLEGKGAAMRVRDWSAWDAQFGPYLDGSAFADMPRKGVPVTHLYLTLSESWPADIRTHYAWKPTTTEYPALITEHALSAPPIEQALDSEYADEIRAIARQFAEHFRQKGWDRTRFQFYMNDKNYYKDPKLGGRGTSWWLLDEPNHRDDWLALAYYARLLREAEQGISPRPILFREDISRPQWQRGMLDGLVDIMVCSGELYTKGPLLADLRERTGVRYWNYGAANPVRESNVTAEGWAVRAWLAGADAIVPWQTVGTDDNYTQPDETALLLPGKRFGITGPVASLRLKALRRAQQDVEYLALLAHAKGWDREQVGAAVAGLLKLDATFDQRNADDAGRYRFTALTSAQFDALRRAIGTTLTRSGGGD